MVGRFDVVEQGDEEMILSLPHDNRLLEQTINEYEIAMVVVDPITSVIGEDINTHHTRELRRALDPLAKIADRTGAIIFGIAHFNKSSGTDVASLLSGSHAFRDVPRTLFGFARDSDGIRVMTQVKNSWGRDDLPSFCYRMESAIVETELGPADTAMFVFDGETDRSVTDVLKDKQTGQQDDHHEQLSEAEEWLVAYMEENGGGAKAKDATKAASEHGISKTTLFRARKKAGVRTDKTGVATGWVWTTEPEEP
jgi:hypothetical protein